MSRYKSLKINNFLGGEGQEFFDIPNKIKISYKMQIDKRKGTVKIADDVSNVDITDTTDAGYMVAYSDGYLYKLLVSKADGSIDLYRSQTGTSGWTKVYDFAKGAASNYIKEFFVINNVMVAVIDNGYTSPYNEVRFYYSTSPASSWSYSFVDTPPSLIYKAAIGDYKAYVMSSAGDLWQTTDGISYTVLFDPGNVDYRFMNIEFLNGFLYVSNSNGDLSKSQLVRLENGTLKVVKNFESKDPIVIKKLGEKLLIAHLNKDNYPEFYFFDGGDFEYLGRILITSFNGINIVGANNEKAWIAISVSENNPNGYGYTVDVVYRHIYSISIDGVFIREQDLGTGLQCKKVIEFNQKKFFDCVYWAATTICKIKYISSDFYYSVAYFYTSLIEIGNHIPIGFILRFENQITKDAGGSTQSTENIKVTTYFDTWTSSQIDIALINYNRAYKIYNDPDLASDYGANYREAFYCYPKQVDNINSFVSFKLDLYSNTALDSSPSIYSLEYVYLPVGLESAK